MEHKSKDIASLKAELARAQERVAELEREIGVTRPGQLFDKEQEIQQLHRSADYLQCLLRTIPDLIWLKDGNGVYLSCNTAFERFFGAKEAEIIGRTDYDFVPRELADFFLENDRRAMQAGKPSINEEWLTFSDGGYQGLFETIKTPMRDGSGQLIGVLGIARDITDRKRTEEALEKRMVSLTRPLDDSESITFDELFNLADIQRLQDEFSDATGVASIITGPDGVPLTAPSNFCNLCNTIINKKEKTCENCFNSDFLNTHISGKNPTIWLCNGCGFWQAGANISIGGQHLANWLIGQVRDAERDERQTMQYLESIGMDMDAAAKDYLNVPVMTREQFGKVAQAMHTLANQLSGIAYQNVQQARFISEKKRTEVQLIELKERAEAANRVKSEFLANMSHEIRTPLNGALSMMQVLKSTALNKEQASYVLAVMNSMQRLTVLLSDILDISKIEAGKFRIVDVAFQARNLENSILELFSQAAEEKGIGLRFSWSGSVPPTLIGDEARLRQIFFNLVGNAVKFTETGGVEVEVSFLPYALESKIIMLLTVSDTGIGITDEQIKNIFEPFVQAEKTYVRRFQGAGLGLSIVRKLVALMNGELAIDNGREKGTVVYVSLPFMVSEQHQAEVDAGLPGVEQAATGPLGILLVEDEAISSMACKLLLEKDGHRVVTARNGLEAIDLLSSDDFDLIFMDIQMPVMDGLETTRKIRNSKDLGRKAEIPIIAMTAYSMVGDRENFLDAGMNAYISKPINGDSVVALLNRLQAGKL
jgi:PAS domain S-box-containing protein